jgi:hypothetical protein
LEDLFVCGRVTVSPCLREMDVGEEGQDKKEKEKNWVKGREGKGRG